MPVILKKKAGSIVQTTAHTKKDTATGKQTDVELPTMKETKTPPSEFGDASVTCDFGRVWTDGNYGSYRVGVTVTLPCFPENVETTFAQAKDIGEQKMKEMLEGTGVAV